MRTRVRITNDDQRHQEFKKDEFGYIDGYVIGGDGAPYAVVVIEPRKAIVLIPTTSLIPIGLKETIW